MVASALKSGVADRRAVFEAFARDLPKGRAYGVVASTDRVVDAIENFRFDEAVVDHLAAAGVVTDPAMLDWLRRYRFSGHVTGYADGELYFAYSPVLTVEGTFAECVVLETVVLSILNYDCAIAAAAARMRDAAAERMLLEGGSRRADPEAAVAAARAAYIGGFDATSNLEAGRRWGVPTGGTTAHAFILAHDDERAAFAAQRESLGVDSTYLVDTYDVLEGIRHAVEVVGPQLGAVRLDSGDLLADSVRARALLDKLGASGCRIVASGDLDEFRIAELVTAGAPIDGYLVGTRLVTGSGHPTASMVYKLVAIEDPQSCSGSLREVSKLSTGKATVGGRKQVHRTIDADGYWEAEVLSLAGTPSPVSGMARSRIYNPTTNLVVGGERVYFGDTAAARQRCAEQRGLLRPEDRTAYPRNTPAATTEWEGW